VISSISNSLKTWTLLAALGALFIAVGGLLGGRSGLVIALVFAVAMNAFVYWKSDSLALKANGARELKPGELPPLRTIVGDLANRAGLPMPRLYVVDRPEPNAFATGRDPQHAAVAVTTGILDLMDERELRGVLAHELSHVKNRDILISSVAATIAAAIMMVGRMAMYAGMFGGYGGRDGDRDRGSNPIALLAMIVLAPLAAMLIQMWISRTREFAADAGGARIAGNPYGLVEALKKIDAISKRVPMDANPATAHMFIIKPFSGAGLMALFSSHPPTEARIRALLGTVR